MNPPTTPSSKASTGKKKTHAHQQHSKPAEVQNITNGIQRLQLGPKKPPAPYHSGHKLDLNGAKVIPNDINKRPQPIASKKSPAPANIQPGSGAAPKKKGDQDDFLKKGLYAGAGFDRSPEASSLPIPKFAAHPKTSSLAASLDDSAISIPGNTPAPLAKSSSASVLRSISVEQLLRQAEAMSCPPPGHSYLNDSAFALHSSVPPSVVLPSMTRKDSQVSSHPGSESDALRKKSETLMKILSGTTQQQQLPSSPLAHNKASPPSTEELEAMTAQVRKLLNL